MDSHHSGYIRIELRSKVEMGEIAMEEVDPNQTIKFQFSEVVITTHLRYS